MIAESQRPARSAEKLLDVCRNAPATKTLNRNFAMTSAITTFEQFEAVEVQGEEASIFWSGRGPLNSWYAQEGGPLGLWQAWANDVRGEALDGGHFFPEEIPQRTAEELSAFFISVASAT
jgi:hypothetical protein